MAERGGAQARFFCKTGALAGSEYRIRDDATVGRGPENAIVLGSDLVSTSHARIAFDAAADAYFLEDLESRNGTRLDGVPISGRARLGDLHVVTIGAHDFLFVLVPDEPPDQGAAEAGEASPAGPKAVATPGEAPPAAAAPAREREPDAVPATRYEVPSDLAAPVLSKGGEAVPATRYEAPSELAVPALEAAVGSGPPPRDEAPSVRMAAAAPAVPAPVTPPPAGVALEIRLPDAEPRRVTLGDGRHVMGRAKDCSLPVNDRTLSRRHAAFVVRGERLTVSDLDSLNGTYLGERTVEQPTEIRVGQQVTLGDRVVAVRIDPRRAPAPEDGGACDVTIGGC